MKDQDKTKEQLIRELRLLRQRNAELKASKGGDSDRANLFARHESQTRKILDALLEHVVYHDGEMKVIWANRAACRSVDLDLEQVVGRHCYEIWAQRSTPCDDCPVARSRETRAPQTTEKKTPDGRHWHIAGAPVFDADGEISGMVELTLDITERIRAEEALKKAFDDQERIVKKRTFNLARVNEKLKQEIEKRKRNEKELRRSEERFRRVFDHAAMGIAITDWQGRFQKCNPAYCSLLGYTEEELFETDFSSLFHPEDREANMSLVRRLQTGELPFFKLENRYIHKDGHLVWAHKVVSVLPDERGRPSHMMALVSDITPQKQAERQLHELNQNLVERTKLAERRAADIQRLAMELSKAEDLERRRLAGVLHDDFQQMLAYLKLKLGLLRKDEENDENLAALNAIIEDCIGRCRNLAHDLRPFASNTKDFIEALKWLCRRMKEMYGLNVSLRAPSDFDIQSGALSSILLRSIRELLFNVVKHSGGKRASIDLGFDSRWLTITVRDPGKGCDPGNLRGKKNRYKTFGLLDIEDRIEFLGGAMRIESEPGRGFRVDIRVPENLSRLADGNRSIPDKAAMDEFKEPTPAFAPANTKPDRSISVLLADDHDLLRECLAKLLREQEGVNVVGAVSNGREAVRLASELKPDIVLMDVNMPVMDGIDATKQIRNLLPDTKIVGLTMHTDSATKQAILTAGASACLTKTGSADELVETMQLVLSEKPVAS